MTFQTLFGKQVKAAELIPHLKYDSKILQVIFCFLEIIIVQDDLNSKNLYK